MQNFVLSFREWLAISGVDGRLEVLKSWIQCRSCVALNGLKRFDQCSRALLEAGLINAGIRMLIVPGVGRSRCFG